MNILTVFGIIYGIVLWLVNIVLCTRLAYRKNRSMFYWGAFAFFFGLLATLWIAAADKIPDEMRPDERKQF